MMLAAVETVTKADPVWESGRHNSYVAAKATARESVHAAECLQRTPLASMKDGAPWSFACEVLEAAQSTGIACADVSAPDIRVAGPRCGLAVSP